MGLSKRLALFLQDLAVGPGSHGVVVGNVLDVAEGNESETAIAELARSEIDNVSGSDLVDAVVHFSGGDASAKGSVLTAEIVDDSGGSINGKEEGGLQLVASASDFEFGNREAESSPLLKDGDQQVFQVVVVGDGGDSKEASVVVAGGERRHALGELLLGDEFVEVRTGVLSSSRVNIEGADQRLENHESVVVRVRPGAAFESDGELDVLLVRVEDGGLRADELGGGNGGNLSGRGEASESLGSEIDELLVLHSSSSDENHSVGGVVVLDVLEDVSSLDASDVLRWAKDGVTQRALLESDRVEVVENDLLVTGFDLLHFSKNHRTLSLNALLGEKRVLDNVGEKVDGLRNILLERSSEEAGDLARSVGIQRSAKVLDLNLQLLSRSAGGALESKMLEEVSGTVVFLSLERATGINVKADGGRWVVGLLSHNPETVGKDGLLSGWHVLESISAKASNSGTKAGGTSVQNRLEDGR